MTDEERKEGRIDAYVRKQFAISGGDLTEADYPAFKVGYLAGIYDELDDLVEATWRDDA